MKKKLIYIFMLLCLFTTMLPSSVRAFDWENDYTIVRRTGVSQTGSKGADGSNYFYSVAFGFRITLTDTKGATLAGPVDFLNISNSTNSKITGIYQNQYYRFPNSKNNIIDYKQRGEKFAVNELSRENQKKPSAGNFNQNLNYIFNGNNYDSAISSLKNIAKNENGELLDFVNKNFGQSYTNDEDLYDLFLIVEPLVIGTVTKKDFNTFCTSYILTSYEWNAYMIPAFKNGLEFTCWDGNFGAQDQSLTLKNNFNVDGLGVPILGYNKITFTGPTYSSTYKGLGNSTQGDYVSIIWLGRGLTSCNDLSSKYSSSYGGTTGRKLKNNSNEIKINYFATQQHFIDVCTEEGTPIPKTTTCNDKVTNKTKFPLSGSGSIQLYSESDYKNATNYTKYYNPNAGYDSNYYVNATCYASTTTCSLVVSNSDNPNASVIKGDQYYKASSLHPNYPGGYYNSNAKYDANYYINSICFNPDYVCEPGTYYAGKNITKEIYDTKSSSLGKYSNNRYDQACYRMPACTDFYNTATDFRNVTLYEGATAATNCCLNYENLYGSDANTLNRLYRDHPECYSCTYTERGINATCTKNSNSSSTGDLFGRGDKTYNEQTCAYYVASGRVDTASSNLVTRRQINSTCKVVCTETVNVKFPLTVQKYYRKGSYIVWPTNVALDESESQLVLSGDTKCWYYVNKVRLNNLYNSNPDQANKEFKQCVDDVIKTYNNEEKIINYDLTGNFSVKYNDKEYGKTIGLTRENSTELEITHDNVDTGLLSYLSNNGVSRYYIDSFINLVESITYNVKQQTNYIIDPTYGYNFSYQGKYSNTNKWGNNAVEMRSSVLGLSSKVYNNGELKIDYSNIGGGSKKYLTTTNEYGVCKYETTDNIPLTCPTDTINSGMNLDIIMENESLSYEEAVEKYCNEPDDIMTTCPEGTDYEGKKILKTCYDNETCRELTCNLHTCTDGGGVCHILNSCISRQMEEYGKTFEDAKNYCAERDCGGNPGNIEYRVIDLQDPFPGEIARSGASSFNTTIKGRKPGQNWNSETIVQREIINNRGVVGDEVYDTTPLYEFELTPEVIKEIREYNDNHEYNDFTLSCKENNKGACIASGFDFRNGYGIVNVIKECRQINNLNQFNACYNNQSLTY